MSKAKPKKEAAPEAEAPEEGAEGEAPAKKKPSLMILIAAGVGALVVLGGGGAAAFMMLGGGNKAHAEGDKAHKAKPKPKKKEGGKDDKKGPNPISEGPDGVIYYTMPDIVANIQTADSKPSYLKLKLAFELPDQESADAIEPNAPRLNDMFQSFLRELRPEDISGSAGSYQLRMELQRRVNLVIAPAKVNAVLIEEMLIN
jgi:flagellar protein FliL